MKKLSVRTILSLIWLVFTLSLVSWWFILAMRNMSFENESAGQIEMQRQHRMLFYEGLTLLVTVFSGGIVMTYLSYRDDQRHQKIRLFFANFSHDIKTSITRLRLQADIMSEDKNAKENRQLQRLIRDIGLLDLQLENSLYLSHTEETQFLIERVSLKALLDSIQSEFPDIHINLDRSVNLYADQRALRSIFKNLIDNARKHGEAKNFFVSASKEIDSSPNIRLYMSDDGKGMSIRIPELGKGISPSSAEKGSGLGIFLSRSLVEKMGGRFAIKNGESGQLTIEIEQKGEIG